jgi:hypothetical protein
MQGKIDTPHSLLARNLDRAKQNRELGAGADGREVIVMLAELPDLWTYSNFTLVIRSSGLI